MTTASDRLFCGGCHVGVFRVPALLASVLVALIAFPVADAAASGWCADGFDQKQDVSSLSFEEDMGKFSEWLATNHTSAEDAWDASCSGAVSNATGRHGPVTGVAFHSWKRVWLAWPLHSSVAMTWQDSFCYADADGNGIVNKDEFGRVYRLHEVQEIVAGFFTKVNGAYPEYSEAWEKIVDSKETPKETKIQDPTYIKETRWRQIMQDFIAKDRLPGGSYECMPSPAMKPFIFAHNTPMEITPGMGTPAQSLRIAQAEALGLVGGSFTAMARIRRADATRRDANANVNHTETGFVFSTAEAAAEDYSHNGSLFLGVKANRIAMSFGKAFCLADASLPLEEWVMVAWVYNAGTSQQRLYANGRSIMTCTGVMPFQGFGKDIWVGKHNGQLSSWLGELSSLYLFPSALTDDEVTSIFHFAPTWSMERQLFISGNDSAAKAGTVSALGLNGTSYTIVLQLLRSRKQNDAAADSYAILTTQKDDAPALVIQNGSLGVTYKGLHCSSSVAVPKAKWVRVAFVYDAMGQELMFIQDGQLVGVCHKVAPFRSGDDMLWIGRSLKEIRSWSGAFQEVSMLNRSECIQNIDSFFKQAFAASKVRVLLGAPVAAVGVTSPPVPRQLEASAGCADAVIQDTFDFVDIDEDGKVSKAEFMFREATTVGDASVPCPTKTVPVPLAQTLAATHTPPVNGSPPTTLGVSTSNRTSSASAQTGANTSASTSSSSSSGSGSSSFASTTSISKTRTRTTTNQSNTLPATTTAPKTFTASSLEAAKIVISTATTSSSRTTLAAFKLPMVPTLPPLPMLPMVPISVVPKTLQPTSQWQTRLSSTLTTFTHTTTRTQTHTEEPIRKALWRVMRKFEAHADTSQGVLTELSHQRASETANRSQWSVAPSTATAKLVVAIGAAAALLAVASFWVVHRRSGITGLMRCQGEELDDCSSSSSDMESEAFSPTKQTEPLLAV